jgi:hypothetical protein
MYFDALSFLEDEREAWRPYEALLALTAEQLETPVVGPDRWSGRDLLGHLVHWQERALMAAKELAMGEHSPTIAADAADWDARGGDVVNAEAVATWRALPLPEVLARAGTVPGELRGYLTVVPEARWIKNAANEEFFTQDLLDHYADHDADLRAILAAVGGAPAR